MCFHVSYPLSNLPRGFGKMLEGFKDVFPKDIPKGLPPIMSIKNHIDFILGATLPNRVVYKENSKVSKEIQKQVGKLIENGWVCESMSPCVLPIDGYMERQNLTLQGLLSRVHISQESRLSRDRLRLSRDRLRLSQVRPYSPVAHCRCSPIRVAQWNYPHQLSSSEATSAPNAMSLLEKRVTQLCKEPGQMENNDKTLKELATPDVVYQPWCIQYPQLEPAQTRRPPQALERIPRGLFHNETVGDSGRLYQDEGISILLGLSSKGLVAHRRGSTRVLEIFNKLHATYPHHQISEQLLIQYFYEGLSMMDRSMIDATSRGALMDKTPVAARNLISNMASNTQQFGITRLSQSQMVNEIDAASNQRLENQLTELTSLVRQLAVGQHQPAMVAKVYGICTFVEHPTDVCPTLQEIKSDQQENVGAIGGFQYGKQPYQTRPFDNQQYGRQPFRPGSP
ncbi:hypothetical protein CR513_05497, partial [Mucuna pruriens]